MKIEGDELDESIVTLDPYNSDLNLVLSANRYSAHPLTSEGFAFMWAGARATHGFAKGKICYEVKILEHLDVSHLPADEPNPHVVRVGFSVESSTMQLGEDPLSYGYGGTGKISTKCQFRDFGSPFMAGDVILACLNMESDPVQMGYAKNGTFLGWAYRISKNELKGQALFPHVLTKNTSFEVNFGQKDKPYFPLPDMARDFTFANCVPLDRRVCGTRAPKKQDCEMIMMCGLPGAGKSVWAAEYSAKHPEKKYNVLGTNNNIDKMKVMGLPRKRNYAGRWDVLIKMATKCLNKMFEIGSKLRRNYILDQTNVYPNAQRKKMSNFEGFVRKAVVIVPTEQEYKRRCDKRDREEGKEVPDSAVLEMKANFKLPEKGDVFDEVMYIELQREEAEKLVRAYNEEGRAATGPPRKQFRPDSGFGNRGGYNSNQGGPPGRGGYSNRGGYEGNDRKPFGGGDNDRKPYGGGDNDHKPYGGGRGGFDRNSGSYDNRGGFGGNRGGFDRNRGSGGFDGNRGGGFDGNRGGGFDGNRGGGFDGNRSGGFDGNRGGGFDGKRGGGFNGNRGGGFDGNRRGGGFDGNRRGGFDGNRGGDFDGNRGGGFDGNRGGGFDGNRGGYDSERRGYEGNRGGNGGYDSNRGDFDRNRGGYDSGYGSSERGRGGYGGGRGGFDRNRGGFEDEPRGYEGSRSGYQDSRGGYSESRGIKRSADSSGYDPSPSGRRSPGGYGDSMHSSYGGSSSNYDNRGGGSFRGRGRGDFGGSRPGGNRGGYSNSPDPYSSGGYVKEESYDKESSYGQGYQGSSSRGQSRGGRGGSYSRGGYSANEYGRESSSDYGSGGYSDYGGQSQGGYGGSSDSYSKGYGSQAPIKREPTENAGYNNSGSRPIQGAARPSGRTTTRWSAAAEETPDRSAAAPSQDSAPYSKYGTQVKTEPTSNTGGTRYDNYSNQDSSFGGYNQSTQPTTGYGSTQQSYGYQQSQPQAASSWPPAQAAAPPAPPAGQAAAADPSQWSQYYQQQQPPSNQYYNQYYGQSATAAAPPTYGYSN